MPSNHFVYMPPQQPLCIVYEDDDLVVIDKPAGLLSVPGRLPEHQDSVDVPLITDWENRPRQMVHFELGKAAKTLYQAVQYFEADDITRVLLTPVTGRSHQLRVHMQYIGHPITGDQFYHPDYQQSALKRMALHASYLAFKQPLSGVDVEIRGNLPF